jgi:hypothetical protein
MTDVWLASALQRLAPHVDDTPAWDDVVARSRPSRASRRRIAALAIAFVLSAGISAGAVASGLLQDTLDHLSAWAGDQPGEPAPQEQAAFDEENADSPYTHFPSGTRVGRLLQFELNGRSHRLLGVRAGTTYCLKIDPPIDEPAPLRPECMSRRDLARSGKSVAVFGSSIRVEPDGPDSSYTLIYGLAADEVAALEVLEDSKVAGHARVENNAFVFAAPDAPLERGRSGAASWPKVVLHARTNDSGTVDYTVMPEGGPIVLTYPDKRGLPGPSIVEAHISSGTIGWLERGEARGEPFDWPHQENFPQHIVHSRLLAPLAGSPFRLGLAYGTGTVFHNPGPWFCMAEIWPLDVDPETYGCAEADLSDQGFWFPLGTGLEHLAQESALYVGLAADEIGRLALYSQDGSVDEVPIVDNAFAFYSRVDETVKLVGWDRQGRVTGIDYLSGGSFSRGP